MKVEDDKYCFACGDQNEIGLHADFTVSEDNSAFGKIIVPLHFQGWKIIIPTLPQIM